MKLITKPDCMDNRKLYEDIMLDVRSVFMKRVNEDLLDDVGEVRVDSVINS